MNPVPMASARLQVHGLYLKQHSRLNRDFSARFVRTMCSGDRQCEFKVAGADQRLLKTIAKK